MKKQPKTTEAYKESIVPQRPAFVTPQQAAEQLDCSEHVIRRMVRRSELRGGKIGGRFKITQASIDAVLHRVFGYSSPTTEAAAPSLAASSQS